MDKKQEKASLSSMRRRCVSVLSRAPPSTKNGWSHGTISLRYTDCCTLYIGTRFLSFRVILSVSGVNDAIFLQV